MRHHGRLAYELVERGEHVCRRGGRSEIVVAYAGQAADEGAERLGALDEGGKDGEASAAGVNEQGAGLYEVIVVGVESGSLEIQETQRPRVGQPLEQVGIQPEVLGADRC